MKKSSFAKQFRKAFKESTKPKAKSYSYHSMKDIELPLSDLVELFSYDDKQGNPIVKIINFKTPIDSFETVEYNQIMALRYGERIELIEELLGPLNNLYIMGHSMGAERALDMISSYERNNYKASWYRNLKGFISLSGIIWGANTSPLSKVKGSPYKDLLEGLKMAENLSLDKSERKNTEAVLDIAHAMLMAYHRTEEKVLIEPSEPKEKHLERLAEVVEIAKIIYKSGQASDISTIFNSKDGGKSVLEILSSNFEQKNKTDNGFAKQIEIPLFSDFIYLANLKEHLPNLVIFEKAKIILQKIAKKLKGTAPEKREDWFRKNTLPTRLRYISLSASLPDPYSHLLEKSDERDFFDLGLLARDGDDYRIQRGLQLESFEQWGARLSDGTADLDMTQFNPERHMSLNKEQKAYTAEHLAIFAADHISVWIGSTSADKDKANPFPRDAIVKSLGAYLNSDK